MRKLFLSIPAGYFIVTRLNSKSAWLFHGYAEYLLGILLLWFSGLPISVAVVDFLLGYLAFICIYEIGYIFNDFISVNFEERPRRRLESWQPSKLLIGFWIIIRLVVFGLVACYLDALELRNWWLVYLLLALAFTMHNTLKRKEYKVFTFICLACLRFYVPIFLFILPSFVSVTLPGVLIHYVFFRTLTYIDSKGLLQITGRNSLSFKAAFYIVLLPFSFLITVITASPLCSFINLYFLLFWGGLLMLEKFKIFSVKDLRTS
jgi:hypothetical protein